MNVDLMQVLGKKTKNEKEVIFKGILVKRKPQTQSGSTVGPDVSRTYSKLIAVKTWDRISIKKSLFAYRGKRK